MNFIELIGFLIALFAMIFLFGKQVKEDRKRSEEADEEEEEISLEEAVQALKNELEQKKEPPKEIKKKPISLAPLHEKPHEAIRKKRKEGDIWHYWREEDIWGKKDDYKAAYEMTTKRKRFHIKSLIRSLPSKKELILFHEIFRPPKGF